MTTDINKSSTTTTATTTTSSSRSCTRLQEKNCSFHFERLRVCGDINKHSPTTNGFGKSEDAKKRIRQSHANEPHVDVEPPEIKGLDCHDHGIRENDDDDEDIEYDTLGDGDDDDDDIDDDSEDDAGHEGIHSQSDTEGDCETSAQFPHTPTKPSVPTSDHKKPDIARVPEAHEAPYAVKSHGVRSKALPQTDAPSRSTCNDSKTEEAVRKPCNLSTLSAGKASRNGSAASTTEVPAKPPYISSLFVDQTGDRVIYFSLTSERVEPLPERVRRHLKFRQTKFTPKVVKQLFRRAGFRIVKGGSEWVTSWGNCLQIDAYKDLKLFQKVNHFPRSFELGRKDSLYKNIMKLQNRCGRENFDFVPQTFVLPQDQRHFDNAFQRLGGSWIVKPAASARGIGIKVVNKIKDVPSGDLKRKVVVQRYISNPYLIDGLKFDIRLYVHVASLDPLRVYISPEGLTRFATQKYSNRSFSNRFVHLTNYSVNKKSPDFIQNEDEEDCTVGHKWSLTALWDYLRSKGIDTEPVWQRIKDLCVKTIISADAPLNGAAKMYLRRAKSAHELFGFDVMLDSKLKPWLLEVNISPSMQASSPLDHKIKMQVVKDVLNLAGVAAVNPKREPKKEKYIDTNERNRHVRILNRIRDEGTSQMSKALVAEILTNMTETDIAVIKDTEDENNRRGCLSRIFPDATGTHLKFFEVKRFYNYLVDAWTNRYGVNTPRGILVLNTLATRLALRQTGGQRQRGYRIPSAPHNNKIRSSPTQPPERRKNRAQSATVAHPHHLYKKRNLPPAVGPIDYT